MKSGQQKRSKGEMAFGGIQELPSSRSADRLRLLAVNGRPAISHSPSITELRAFQSARLSRHAASGDGDGASSEFFVTRFRA
jgi:hypothetical protein